MEQRENIPRFFILILSSFSLIFFTCSMPSWFPIKKGSSHQAKMKELLDKEVVIIDQEEYVKVLNPKFSEGKDQTKYLYVPVIEYLSRKETFTPKPIQKKEETQITTPSFSPPPPLPEEQTLVVSPSEGKQSSLKKKVLVLYFDDRTTEGEEVFGDWVSEKLMKEVNRRSPQISFIDYQMVMDFLEKRGTPLSNIESPEVLYFLNEAFGIQIVVQGQLSGPYVFTTHTPKDRDRTASAIIKMDLKLIDALTGKTLKILSAQNPILATKEGGLFPEEKAKIKAIDLTLPELGQLLSKELDGIEWFCRIAKVEGDEVFINAGRLTGLKTGDIVEVYRYNGTGVGEVIGKIQIANHLGIDASIGKVIQGKIPEVKDILKMAKSERTIR